MMPTVRSVGRYRSWAGLLATLVGVTGLLGVLASPGGASPRVEAAPEADPPRVGMNSCAARGCHGAVDAVAPARGDFTIKGGAYTTWLNFDPHASAYDVLLDSRSVQIARHLEKSLKGKPAHEADLCLSCHATVDPPPAPRPEVAQLKWGITCESCHGSADVWQDKHLDAAWRAKPASAKVGDGMTDLSTPAARAKTCVACHVGDRSRGMDMNHDLIAAGHPRLNFEFASYQAAYPKHWKEKPGPPGEFEARSWAAGQVVTARAVLDLLAARASASKDGGRSPAPAPAAIWPEFSEYECFACHHALVKDSPLQKSEHVQGKPGKLPWATWPSTMLPELAKGRTGIDLDAPDSPWAKLKREMARGEPDAGKVADLAQQSTHQLDQLLEAIEKDPINADRINVLLKNLAARPLSAGESWDRAAQQYLAVSSLARSAKDLKVAVGPEVEETLRAGWKVLEFPPRYDSPRNDSPGATSSPKP